MRFIRQNNSTNLKTMYRILYVSRTAQIGGGEVSLLNLVKRLDKELFLPIVVVSTEGPLVERLKAIGVRTKLTPLMEFSRHKWLSFFIAAIRLAFLIRKEKIDLVHANSIYVAEQSYLAGKLAGILCVCHIRDLVPILGAGKVRSMAFRKMDRLIAISDAVKRDLVEKLNIPEDKITRIYNGVDTREFNPGISGDRFRQEFNLGSRKLIGIIGRLSPEKGHEIFLKAGRNIVKNRDEVMFVIVGNSEIGPKDYKTKLEAMAQELGIKNRVIFTGFRDDIPRVMAALDIVVVPSLAEPFGRVIVEAMAMEKPVIAANSGAVPELISDGSGLLIESDSIKGLESAIVYLLENNRECKRLGERGRKVAIERFDTSFNISEIERLYNKLLLPTTKKDRLDKIILK